MDEVDYPLDGYRAKPQFSVDELNIVPENPARPELYVLSAYYAPASMPLYQKTVVWANRRRQFPGSIDEMTDLIPQGPQYVFGSNK